MKNRINSGKWGPLHCQGMTMDKEKKFIYYSFTTKLVKTDIDGNIIGSVDHIIGHLGCIDFNDNDGKVYASLEFKKDSIGRDILATLGISDDIEEAFYVAIFDVDKIDRLDMDAEKDGIMRTVFMKTVFDDYSGKAKINGKEVKHIHGCSGIDGLAIGPQFGSKDKKEYLHLCYGIYNDHSRDDNDYNVILEFDVSDWWEKALPLNQYSMHRVGPDKPLNKLFLYTGNTTWGIQNLEYDGYSNTYLVCVYCGDKEEFTNYPMFVLDQTIAPRKEKLIGYDNYEGLVLTLKDVGGKENKIPGLFFKDGSMGVHSFNNGVFYFVSANWDDPQNLWVESVRYNLNKEVYPWEFEEVK